MGLVHKHGVVHNGTGTQQAWYTCGRADRLSSARLIRRPRERDEDKGD